MSPRSYVACLLCGGKGNRLLSVTNGALPKSLVQVDGQTLLQFSLDAVDGRMVSNVVFAVDFQSEKIQAWVENRRLPFLYSFSRQAYTGILPAIQAASRLMAGKTLIVCNTDEIRLGFQLQRAITFHESHQRRATMVVTTATNLHKHRVVVVGPEGVVLSTTLKDARYITHPEISGLVNTGVVILEPEALEYSDPSHSTEWSGIIDPLVDKRQLGAFVDTTIRYFNVGTKAEYLEAVHYLEQHPRKR